MIKNLSIYNAYMIDDKSKKLLFQLLISFSSVFFLVVFIMGAPAKALLPLWGNIYEVKNAMIYMVVLSAVAAIATVSGRRICFIFAVLAALIITAGPAAVVWAVLASFSAAVIGYQVLGFQSTSKMATSSVGRFVLAFWIGKAVYILVLSVLSFFPVNTRFIQGCLIFGVLIISPQGLAEARRVLNILILKPERDVVQLDGWAVGKFFLLLSALLLIVAAIHPGFDGDAATMHMRIAREILNRGFWDYDVTQYGFAVMPLAPQLNMSAMFLVGGIDAVKVDLTIQFLMTIALVVTGGGFRIGAAGLVFGSLFCFSPIFVREISSLFIEVTLCGFVLAAATLIASAVRRKSLELSVFAALCAAGAMATKPFGLLLGPIVMLVFLLNVKTLGSLNVISKVRVIFGLLSAIVLGLIFYFIAWVKTGNPFFPFYNGVFKSTYWRGEDFLDRRWVGHLSWDLPWKMTFDSSIFEESSNGSMGLSLLFLTVSCASLVALTRRNMFAAIPLCVGVVYLVAVGIQVQYLRYLLPGVLLIAMSLAYYLQHFIGKPRWPLLCVTLLSLLIANFFGMPSGRFTNGLMHIPIANRFVAGTWRGLPSDNFHEETLNGHKYVADVLNASSREVPTVLMLGCSYGAYFNGRTIYTTWLNYSWQINESQLFDPEKFQRYLTEKNVTHVVIDGCTGSDQRKNFVPLVTEHSNLMAELWGVELYKLRR